MKHFTFHFPPFCKIWKRIADWITCWSRDRRYLPIRDWSLFREASFTGFLRWSLLWSPLGRKWRCCFYLYENVDGKTINVQQVDRKFVLLPRSVHAVGVPVKQSHRRRHCIIVADSQKTRGKSLVAQLSSSRGVPYVVYTRVFLWSTVTIRKYSSEEKKTTKNINGSPYNTQKMTKTGPLSRTWGEEKVLWGCKTCSIYPQDYQKREKYGRMLKRSSN